MIDQERAAKFLIHVTGERIATAGDAIRSEMIRTTLYVVAVKRLTAALALLNGDGYSWAPPQGPRTPGVPPWQAGRRLQTGATP